MSEFQHQPLFPLGADDTEYRRLDVEGVSSFEAEGQTFLKVAPEALTVLAREALRDIYYLGTESGCVR